MKLPLVVLISGSGSNLQAIIDGAEDGTLPAEIKAVISNKAEAYGLVRAEKAGIKTRVLDHREFEDRDTYDQALGKLVEEFQPGLVILAGFMRILTPGFVRRFHGRMLNIHPSLLPKHRGLHTHQRAIAAGDSIHGASVHFVTEELDGGPIILQVKVPVEADDNESTLAARVLTQEHVIYPTVIRWFAQSRLKMERNGVMMDNQLLNQPLSMEFQAPLPL
ncbi:MAG: phosphoribosylglycinamide formyltransferase [Gammaproteobacteria bacterium]|nr:phosphoribosylglycinamide formyltransferase [Gammaproteobacteria bacterium]